VPPRQRKLTFEGTTLYWREPFRPTLSSEGSPTPSAPILWPDRAEGPFEVRLFMQRLRGRNECVGIEIRPAPGTDPRPLLSSELREVPMREMIDDERRQYLEWLRDIHSHRDEVAEQLAQEGKLAPDDLARFDRGIRDLYGSELATGAGAEIRGKSSRRGGRRPYDDAFYQRVAAVYTEAWRARDFPTKAVGKAFFKNKSTAAKWVAKCREKGMLPPTTRGRASIEPASDTVKEDQ
jgi:hypothetical protein